MSDSAILADSELLAITGYRQPAAQLAELHRQGFYRARMSRLGGVIVERPHHEAIAARISAPAADESQPLDWRPLPRRGGYNGGLARFHAAQREASEARQRALEEREAEHAAWIRSPEYAAWAAEDREARREQRRALVLFHANKRRAAKLLRTPAWADMDAIREIYAAAARLSKATGEPHHVDHIIPLQGALVSGLHVAENLQVLPGRENSRKRNRFEVT